MSNSGAINLSGSANSKSGRKKRKVRDCNAPRRWLTGFMHYQNARRDQMRAQNKSMTFAELNKQIAGEWNSMDSNQKQKYLDEAQRDKERYQKEMEQYQQTETYRLYTAHKDKQNPSTAISSSTSISGPVPQTSTAGQDESNGCISSNAVASSSTGNAEDESTNMAFDVPIFTEDFLEHNKMRDMEMRQLRKSITDYEEQNAILSKHIDNVKVAIDKLHTEAVSERNINLQMQDYQDKVNAHMAEAFSAVPLPPTQLVATKQNMDVYMATLLQIMKANSPDNEGLINSANAIFDAALSDYVFVNSTTQPRYSISS